MPKTKNTHGYLALLYIRIAVLTSISCVLLGLVLPKVIETSNNNTWNNNAISTCADVIDLHIVEFYRSNDPSTNPQPYYDGYVTVKYLAYNRNYTYEFVKFSAYINRTQLNLDLHSCCEVHQCINIHYQKNNPGDAKENLMDTYEFPSWLSVFAGGLLLVIGCLYGSYRYDHKRQLDLLFIQTLGGSSEFIT